MRSTEHRSFCLPPIDGSLDLPGIYEWHAEHNAEYPTFIFKGASVVETLRWQDLARAVRAGARIVKNRIESKINPNKDTIIAILALSEGISYSTMVVAVMRADCIPFPISPRNSPEAIAHLINTVGVEHILFGREESTHGLLRDALELLSSRYSSRTPRFSFLPNFEELFSAENQYFTADEDVWSYPKNPNTTAMVMHSSGSTSFPKPIYWTHGRMTQLCLAPHFSERHLAGLVFSVHAAPMFHAAGLIPLCWMIASGLIFSAFDPGMPEAIPTPGSVFKAAKATDTDLIFVAPAFIEAWSHMPECVQWFASHTDVLYCGGPLSKEAGDYMVSHGVSVVNILSSTECGPVSPILPAVGINHEWEYFKFSPMVTVKMVPFMDVHDVFELVVVANANSQPSVLNTSVDGVNAYATSDLLQRHPTKLEYWRVFGRSDDQIMHSTGEKTNPGPLENILNHDPRVLSSVIFGRGQFQAGVLVDPKTPYKFDPLDHLKLAEFRNVIWPTVERMNAYAPQHSRIFKEMILIARPSKPFTYTAKSTARRQAIISDYQEEIDALYDTVQETTHSDIATPSKWNLASTTQFVRLVVSKTMRQPVNDDDNLFEHACDSLQATWIRNSILRALRETINFDVRKASSNLVYDHPSISQLSVYITNVASGLCDNDNVSAQTRVDAMLAVVDKYSESFPVHQVKASVPHTSGDIVLTTGTTGNLGCHILARLARDQKVSRVYALNRVSETRIPLYRRQEAALTERELDVSMLKSDKIVLVEADLTVPNFGLPQDTYLEMQRSVTHIIHTAWKLDFNLSLSSFEPNIEGLRCLIDFALASPRPEPPQLTYTSSVGVFQNFALNEVYTEIPVTPYMAVGSGYSESKWASEEILSKAMECTPLRALSVRVGQISGSASGIWNAHEWFPAMVQSALVLGIFPNGESTVSWVPPEVAAGALVDFSRAAPAGKVIHLIHPRPVSWQLIASVVSSVLDASLVPYGKWLEQLDHVANSDQLTTVKSSKDLRALRMLPFFMSLRMRGGPTSEVMAFPSLATTNAVATSPTLADTGNRQLGASDVKRWLAYWRTEGLLQ